MPGDIQRITGLGTIAIVPFAFTTTATTVEVSAKGFRKFRCIGYMLAGSTVDPQDGTMKIDETYDAATGVWTTPAAGTLTLTRQAAGESGLSGTITLLEA